MPIDRWQAVTLAVMSGWGVDAQWIQGEMHDEAGWEKAVPLGGSVWVSRSRIE